MIFQFKNFKVTRIWKNLEEILPFINLNWSHYYQNNLNLPFKKSKNKHSFMMNQWKCCRSILIWMNKCQIVWNSQCSWSKQLRSTQNKVEIHRRALKNNILKEWKMKVMIVYPIWRAALVAKKYSQKYKVAWTLSLNMTRNKAHLFLWPDNIVLKMKTKNWIDNYAW